MYDQQEKSRKSSTSLFLFYLALTKAMTGRIIGAKSCILQYILENVFESTSVLVASSLFRCTQYRSLHRRQSATSEMNSIVPNITGRHNDWCVQNVGTHTVELVGKLTIFGRLLSWRYCFFIVEMGSMKQTPCCGRISFAICVRRMTVLTNL